MRSGQSPEHRPPALQISGTRAQWIAVYGVNAALATIAHRPGQIGEAHFSHSLDKALASRVLALRERGVAVRGVPDSVLERMVESTHHEGLVLIVRRSAALSVSALSELLRRVEHATVIALDRVSNPHNVGAVIRSAAFFQADALLLEGASPTHVLTPAAIRVAEGGAESLMLASAPNLAQAITQLKKQSLKDRPLTVYGLERTARTDLRTLRRSGPALWVLGSEREGLSDEVRAQCDQLVCIASGSSMDSLNVSVAAGIVLSHATAHKAGTH
jgi:TrmH RNA methyltransferase